MASKGKAKAVMIIDDGSDDDLAYFTAKKRTYTRPLTPVRASSPAGLSDVSENESEEDGGGPKKKKRKKKKVVPQRKLPEWTRQSSTSENGRKRSVGRGSTEERRDGGRGDAIYIDDSDDEGKGKGKASTARRRIQLTPPPELSAARKAELKAAMEKHFAAAVDPLTVDEEPDITETFPTYSTTSNVDSFFIRVRMVADPMRTAAGASANAVKAYERARQINLRRDQPLTVVYGFLAKSISKQPEEIVLVYKGQKIYSSSVTPKSLRMSDDVELLGYEIGYWERLEKEKQRERQRLLNDGRTPPRESNDERTPSPDIQPVEPLSEPAQTARKLRLSLRGAWGEHRMHVDAAVTAAVMLKWYCREAGRDPSEAGKLQLQFDGEVIPADTAVRDMDVEDKDLVDVV